MQTVSDVVTNWLVGVAFGVFFGLVCAWFWALGSVAKAFLDQKKMIPQWLVLIAGENPRTGYTKKGWVIMGRVDAFSKGFSIFLLLAFLTWFHLGEWTSFIEGGLPKILLVETSVTLSFLLTWGLLVLSLECFLKRLPQRTESSK